MRQRHFLTFYKITKYYNPRDENLLITLMSEILGCVYIFRKIIYIYNSRNIYIQKPTKKPPAFCFWKPLTVGKYP